MASDITVKLKLDGESEFKRGLTNVNAELKNMQSQLKLCNTETQGSANTLESLTRKHEALQKVIEASEKKEEMLTKALENAIKNQVECSKQLEEVKNNQNATAEAVEKAQKAYDSSAKAVNVWETQLNNAKTTTAQYKNELEQVDQYLAEANESATKTATSIDEMGKATKTAADNTEELKNIASNAAAMEAMSEIADKLTAAFQKLASAAYEAALELDEGYDIIITKTGAAGEQLADMTQQANQIYTTMAVGMSDIGTAIGEVNTRFGVTGDTLRQMSEEFLRFAEINETDVNTSIDKTDRILTQFGESADAAQGFLGMISKRCQETGRDATTLMNNLSDNAPLLKAFGLSLEESTNFLAKFEDIGVEAVTAMQGLKRAAAEYAKEGMSMREGLEATIDSIKNATTETEAYGLAQEVFGTRGFTVMADAIRDGRFNLEGLNDNLYEYTSIVKDTYEATLDGWDKTTVAMNNLKLAGSELTQAFYMAATPAIEAMGSVLNGIVEAFLKLPEPLQSIVAMIGALGVGLGTVVPQMMSLATTMALLSTLGGGSAIGALTTSLKSFATTGLKAVAGLANPVTLAIAAIGAFAIAANEYANYCEDMINKSKELSEKVDSIGNSIKKTSKTTEDLAKVTQKAAEATNAYSKAEEAHTESAANANEIDATRMELEQQLADLQQKLLPFAQAENMTIEELAENKDRLVKNNQKLVEAYIITRDTLAQMNDKQSENAKNIKASANEMIAYAAILQTSQDDTRKATTETMAMVDMFTTSVPKLMEVATSLTALNTEYERNSQNTQAAIDAIKGQMEALQQSYDEAYNSCYTSLESQFGLFNTMTVTVDQSVTDMIASLDSQIAYMNTYAENIRKAAELGIDDGLLKKLSDGSVESAKILQAIVDDGGQNIGELNEKFKKVEEGKKTFSDEMAQIQTNFDNTMASLQVKLNVALTNMNQSAAAYQSAIYTIQGYINGTDALSGSLVARYFNLGKRVTAAYRSAVDIGSPSKVAKQDAKWTVMGYIEGTKEMSDALAEEYRSLAHISVASYAESFGQATKGISQYNNYVGGANTIKLYIGDRELSSVMTQSLVTSISGNARMQNASVGRR